MIVQVKGIEVYYEQLGEGADALFLHGWGCQCDTYAVLTQHIKAYRRITILDLPGFGKSGRPSAEGWSVDDYTSFILAFMDAVGLRRADIFAHSHGARVAIKLAATQPERVNRAVFTGAAGLLKKRTARYYAKVYGYKLGKRMARIGFVTKAAKAVGFDVEKRVKNAGSPDYRALDEEMKRTFVRVVNEDLRPYLGRIRAPVLLIWGENDTETPLTFGHIMAKEIPDAGLCVLDGCGHYAFLEQPGAFLRIVDAFWRDIS